MTQAPQRQRLGRDEEHAYHIGMNVFLYLLAAVVTIVIALLTVSAQTIRAARTNPANTLRYE